MYLCYKGVYLDRLADSSGAALVIAGSRSPRHVSLRFAMQPDSTELQDPRLRHLDQMDHWLLPRSKWGLRQLALLLALLINVPVAWASSRLPYDPCWESGPAWPACQCQDWVRHAVSLRRSRICWLRKRESSERLSYCSNCSTRTELRHRTVAGENP